MAYVKEQWRSQVQNGKIDTALLSGITPPGWDVDLKGPHLLHPEAAWNLTRLIAAAKNDGVTVGIVHSYRTLEVQWVKWYDYKNGGNLAAYPGTSNHGWAVSVDIGSTDANVAWMQAHAKKFGFINDVPSERWHWTYQGGYPVQEDDMAYEDFKKGWKEFQSGRPEPTQEGDEKFGWNAAKYASSKPLPGAHTHAGYAPVNHTHAVTGVAG